MNINIPDNATNGDVIKALFPNWEYKDSAVKIGYDYNHYIDCYVTKTWVVSFDKYWWNAPYKEKG